VCWLALAMVLLQFAIVLLRYLFGISYIFLRRRALHARRAVHAGRRLHPAGRRACPGRHLLRPAGRAGGLVIDVFGGLVLLLPSLLVILWVTWPFVRQSWILEGPMSVGGIPASFLLKSLIPAFCILLSIQGLSLGLSADAAVRPAAA
jgi:TRAP-type mannitol/chloroaromatic compound transport system permease small subunit